MLSRNENALQYNPTLQSESQTAKHDKQKITCHINNAVSCNAQSSAEAHKATKLSHHQSAPNHHLPHCTDGLCIAQAFSKGSCEDPLHICAVPYYGMCVIVSVCCAWPMTHFLCQFSSSARRGMYSDGRGQLHCQDGIHKPWMAWWFGTHASSRTPYGYAYKRDPENRAYAKVRQQNLMGIYTNLCARKFLSVVSEVNMRALQKEKGREGKSWHG